MAIFFLAKYTKYIYWFLPAILFFAQAVYVFNSFEQIRFEELIESVQAPFWFYHHQLIAGTHTNVGWYATLSLIYQIFGFSLNTPKYFLLVLYGISSLCQVLILRKFFSPVVGSIILLTLGLSPTLLTFNSQNLHLGVGLMVVPILIWLLIVLDFKKTILAKVITIVISLASIWALLVYPPFMFYLPAVGLFFFKKISNLSLLSRLRYLIFAFFAFLMPVVFFFGYNNTMEVRINS